MPRGPMSNVPLHASAEVVTEWLYTASFWWQGRPGRTRGCNPLRLQIASSEGLGRIQEGTCGCLNADARLSYGGR